MIKAILMDFNGVIINDEPLQMRAYQDVLKREDIELTEADYYSCLGMDDKTFVRAAFSRAGRATDDSKVSELVQAKTAVWNDFVEDNLPVFGGTVDFVRKMEREFHLGLVSMANRHEIDHVLTRLDIADCFTAVISAENVTRCKPDPECYHQGFYLLDAARSARGRNPMVHNECVVIEDSPPGIRAGRAAGMKTLGVTNTVDEKTLREAGAHCVTRSLDDWMPGSIQGVFGGR
jgi:beta-phosphoglucomutase